ncbi:MAG: divalent-cation tolerance protein CutA [Candidatus Aenigmarchaeota archaeon]|nr:divalent-cation tolerance protein CutA [Candidatus Aenigmarchaeota archaeon]
MKYIFVYVTTTDEKEAKEISEALVEEKLAACTNIFPIKSIYRWKGKIQKENEVPILIKTKAELVDKVIKRVKELHSYEVPCTVSIPIEKGYADFFKWISETTK